MPERVSFVKSLAPIPSATDKMNNENNHDDDDNDNDHDHDDDNGSFLRPMPFDTLHVRHFVCDDMFCGAYNTTRI